MTEIDHDLQRLQDLLEFIPPEYDPMCVAQLDGYFAALIVCPDMIPPSEWLPRIWGEEYAFADAAEAEATVAAVMLHYNRIVRELADCPEEYAPVLEIDPDTGEPLWDLWIDGFERAMRLRPDVWEEIALSGDEEASGSVNMILALSEILYGRSELTEEAEADLDLLAPGLIQQFVINLNAWTKSREFERCAGQVTSFANEIHGDDPPAHGRKAEGNEPCPCGSGRKYKRCCGAH